jgi:hypothetical protein
VVEKGMNFVDTTTRRFNTLLKSWLPSFSSPPGAGEITEGEAGCEGFFNSLLARCA